MNTGMVKGVTILIVYLGCYPGECLVEAMFTEYLADTGTDLSWRHGVPLCDIIISYLLYVDDLTLFSDTTEGL